MPRAFPLVCLICCCAGLATAEPPERFAARMQGNSAIALSWEAVAGADALVVQRSATGGGWQDVATLPGSATAYTDNGLPSASLRLYRLALQVGGAVVGHSPLAWASSGEPVTSASTTQRTYALRLPEGGVRLYWEHRFGDVLRFRVESQLGSGAWTFRADASADTGSLVLPDPERSQTLKLRIRPESATATGAWTDAYAMVQAPYRVREVSPFPFAVDGATVAPANLTVQRQGPSTFLLNWTGSASDILRATDAATWHGLGVGNGLSTATVSTASHGLAQRFAVYNAGGWSNVVSIPALARDPSLPPASNVSSTLSGTTATITWDWSGSGATGFCVERWDHALLTDTWTTVAEVGAAQRSVVDPNSTSWVTYRVWVRSAIGWGPVAEMPLRDYPTAAPSGLVATAVSATQVSLSWTGTHYRHCLQRAEGAGPWRDLGPVGTTTFIDRGVVPGTTYRYRVSAVTRGTYANEITVAVPAPTTAPAAVTGLSVTGAAPSQINAAWSPGSGSPATAFSIATSPDGASWTTVATLPGDARTWRLTGLGAGTLRHVRVIAQNAAGSAAAVSGSATTPSSAPSPGVTVRTSPIGGWRILVVTGTAADDDLELRQSASLVTVHRAGVQIASQSGPFTEVRLLGGSGDDRLRIDGSVRIRAGLFGGPGDDTLIADGSAPQTAIVLGQGRDSVSGRAGLVDYWVDRDGIDSASVNAADEAAGRVHRVLRFDRDHPLDPSGQDLAETGVFASPGRSRLPDQPLWGDGPGMLDINQGVYQDCPFTSSFQELATAVPELIQRLVVDLGDGTYAIEVEGGQARIDGEFLLTYTCKPPPSGQVWGLVLEKALVGYGLNLPGWVEQGGSQLSWAESDAETAYQQVRSAIAAGRSINLFSRRTPLLDFDAGNPCQHAHSIFGAFRAADGTPRFIIRNPYGIYFEMGTGFPDWRAGLRVMTWAQISDTFIASYISTYAATTVGNNPPSIGSAAASPAQLILP